MQTIGAIESISIFYQIIQSNLRRGIKSPRIRYASIGLIHTIIQDDFRLLEFLSGRGRAISRIFSRRAISEKPRINTW